MPQFSLKRLFVSVTLIAVGCAMFGWNMRMTAARRTEEPLIGALLVLFTIVGPFLIGAGIGNLFTKALAGGCLGCLFFVILALCLVGFALSTVAP